MSDKTNKNFYPSGIYSWIIKSAGAEPYEIKALLLSMLYFFSLLCSYYIIRPIRDEMGIAGGVENLQWLFTGTFLAMISLVPLFGWISSKYPRTKFVPYVYYFFIINLLVFFALFKSNISHRYIARAFFIWTSVFNLFVVSLFWSYMSDIYNESQAKRLFGFIASGGTIGAIAGPVLTTGLVLKLGPTNLLVLSAVFLGISLFSIYRLSFIQQNLFPRCIDNYDISAKSPQTPMYGSIIAAFRLVIKSPYLLGICLLVLLYTTLATFLYFEQAKIISVSFSDPAHRTAVFAGMDFAVNALTVVIQLFLTGRIIKSAGLARTLALIPFLLGIGFLMLSFAPLLWVIIVVQVARRAGNYSIMRPARETLFTVLNDEEKYKAKNFIDTAVYRGGDAVSAWVYSGLSSLGLGLTGIAIVAIPLSYLWVIVSYRLGIKRERIAGNIKL